MSMRGAPMVENHARERLTGAAILVAVIVLLVPELLSGPRRAVPQAIAVIDEAPVRSYTLSLGDAQQSAVAATADGPRAAAIPPADAPMKPATGNAGSAVSAAAAMSASSKAESPPPPAAVVAPVRPAAAHVAAAH